jgi:hypothetical protein
LQPAQKLSAETNQRIAALEEEVEKIESQLAQHVVGLGKARSGCEGEQVQPTIPNDAALIDYLFSNTGYGAKQLTLTPQVLVDFDQLEYSRFTKARPK